MRLKVSKSKNAASFYVIKSIYNKKTKSNTSKIVEKLGTEAEVWHFLKIKMPASLDIGLFFCQFS